MNRKNRRRHAFTLLELMIVLVILVLLLAMVGPRLLGTQKKAYIKNTKAQIGIFKTALDSYAAEVGHYPSTEDGLQALLEAPSDDRAAQKWEGPYLDSDVLPLDPWDNEYQYEYPPTNNRRDFPDVWSYGPDGEDGTDDDITNWSGTGGGGGSEEEPGDTKTRDKREDKQPREKASRPPREPQDRGESRPSKVGGGTK